MINIKEFFDAPTWTLTYVVHDPKTKDAVIIDPVLDYDPNSSTIEERSIEIVSSWVREHSLKVHMIVETHAHADHISGSQGLLQRFPGAKLAIGENIKLVQKRFAQIYDLPADFKTDGSQFDILLKDGSEYTAGTLRFKVLSTPGHTPACCSYLFEDALFTGDAIFMPDYGTGRCDFPDGSASNLWESITKKIYSLPDETRIFTGHDYMPGGRPLRWQSTVGEEKKSNIQLKGTTSREDFFKFRTERDKTLTAPRLLLPSVQLNIDAGHLPRANAAGQRFLKIPLVSKA
jgi:glyoxylase-like metal-dependent hydrolase (beta-lactamase superfamily II)